MAFHVSFTHLQHDGSRLVHFHDLSHHGLENSLEGPVVDPVPQRHVHGAVLQSNRQREEEGGVR